VAGVVDTMPCDAGRNVVKLAAISAATGVHVVAPTGLHHQRYYGERHWSDQLDVDEMAGLFVADIETGIDALDYGGPVVRRTEHRAGIVKVAGSEGGLTDRDRRTFEAAAIASNGTGVPVITHCEHGAGGAEQVAMLDKFGVAPQRVLLSHTDKVADLGYHRELLQSGANVVYDQGLRTPEQTADIVTAMVEEGFGRQVLLGTDGARRSLWRALGGSPGLAALRTGLGATLADRLGPHAMAAIWVANPARVLALEPA
jgi:phosphotriesterase-related protein